MYLFRIYNPYLYLLSIFIIRKIVFFFRNMQKVILLLQKQFKGFYPLNFFLTLKKLLYPDSENLSYPGGFMQFCTISELSENFQSFLYGKGKKIYIFCFR